MNRIRNEKNIIFYIREAKTIAPAEINHINAKNAILKKVLVQNNFYYYATRIKRDTKNGNVIKNNVSNGLYMWNYVCITNTHSSIIEAICLASKNLT